LAVEQDSIIVIDIEATCWKQQPPPGQQHEIIEIGVCRLDLASGELADRRSILVKPQRSKVSPFCTALTSLTQEMVDEGMLLGDACTLLQREYGAAGRLWASWGDYDRLMFERQTATLCVDYPFSQQHMNVKQVYAGLNKQRKGRAVGMAKALDQTGLGAEGRLHRGVDDAWNLGRLLQYLLRTQGPQLLEPYW
jgi:inhibitor of KinA sporulation pathway (predicted exonuclease)